MEYPCVYGANCSSDNCSFNHRDFASTPAAAPVTAHAPDLSEDSFVCDYDEKDMERIDAFYEEQRKEEEEAFLKACDAEEYEDMAYEAEMYLNA